MVQSVDPTIVGSCERQDREGSYFYFDQDLKESILS
jgi:hypothetical protein